MAPQLQAAAARTVITPPVGITHAHWGAQTHTRATGVDMELWATALVVANAEEQLCIVDVDAIGIRGDTLTAIREGITRLTGIPASHQRISVSHTHSGGNNSPAWYPDGSEVIGPYVATLPDRIAGAVWEAQRSLRPARLAAGKGRSNVGINRRMWLEAQRRVVLGRNYEGFVDHEMVVARLDDEHEQPIAVLVNYGCHPTIMAHLNSKITPDYPGQLRRTVEGIVGGKCLFLQGAAGDVHPKETYSSKPEAYRHVGQVLGLEAARVALELEPLPKVGRLLHVLESGAELGIYADEPGREPDATLRVLNGTATLPIIDLPPVEQAERVERDAHEALGQARASGDAAAISHANMLAKRAGMRAGMSRAYHGKSSTALDIQIMRLGGLALVAMPGEPFSAIGAGVKQRSPFPVTMFSGYSNGDFAYIPMRRDYELGGYGVWNSPVGPGGAEGLIEQVTALLQRVA